MLPHFQLTKDSFFNSFILYRYYLNNIKHFTSFLTDRRLFLSFILYRYYLNNIKHFTSFSTDRRLFFTVLYYIDIILTIATMLPHFQLTKDSFFNSFILYRYYLNNIKHFTSFLTDRRLFLSFILYRYYLNNIKHFTSFSTDRRLFFTVLYYIDIILTISNILPHS